MPHQQCRLHARRAEPRSRHSRFLPQQHHDHVRIHAHPSQVHPGIYHDILQLAPNGKIYISCWNGGSNKIHVINQPDSLGLACDFRFLGQPVLTQSPQSIPYFPNFWLGALAGSCDTISTDIRAIEDAHPAFAIVTPNPAKDKVFLIYYTGSNSNNEAELYDIAGKLVWSKTSRGTNGTIPIDIASLSNGIYMTRFVADGKEIMNSKLVISH